MPCKAYFLIVAFIFICCCENKDVPISEAPDIVSFFSQATDMIIYDIGEDPTSHGGNNETKICTHFDVNLFREFAKKAKFEGKPGFWKGSLPAVVKMKDGTERILIISIYGSFFSILDEKGIFYLEGKTAELYNEKIHHEIVQKLFIPKRIKRNKSKRKRKNS